MAGSMSWEQRVQRTVMRCSCVIYSKYPAILKHPSAMQLNQRAPRQSSVCSCARWDVPTHPMNEEQQHSCLRPACGPIERCHPSRKEALAPMRRWVANMSR